MNTPRLLLLAVLPFLAGCAPTFNVAVPKPVVIDVNMKVDVTSRNETPKNAPASGTDAKEAKDNAQAGAAGEANRLSGEVQALKDSHLVGEGNDGYLAVRKLPGGNLPTGEDYDAYVKRIVEEENRARRTIYGTNAAQHGVPVDAEARAAAKRLAESAYAGEWIQAASGEWKQR